MGGDPTKKVEPFFGLLSTKKGEMNVKITTSLGRKIQSKLHDSHIQHKKLCPMTTEN